MDFTSRTGYTLTHSKDPISGVVTLTIKDPTGVVTIGDIQIEYNKLRALLDSLAEVGKTFYPDIRSAQIYTTNSMATSFSASQKKIIISSGTFPDWVRSIGQTVKIIGTNSNDRNVTILASTATSLTVNETLVNENGSTVTFILVATTDNWRRSSTILITEETAITRFSAK